MFYGRPLRGVGWWRKSFCLGTFKTSDGYIKLSGKRKKNCHLTWFHKFKILSNHLIKKSLKLENVENIQYFWNPIKLCEFIMKYWTFLFSLESLLFFKNLVEILKHFQTLLRLFNFKKKLLFFRWIRYKLQKSFIKKTFLVGLSLYHLNRKIIRKTTSDRNITVKFTIISIQKKKFCLKAWPIFSGRNSLNQVQDQVSQGYLHDVWESSSRLYVNSP